MEQQIVTELATEVIKSSWFTPLECILMSAVVGLFIIFYKFVKGTFAKVLVAITNNTNVTNELIEEIRRK